MGKGVAGAALFAAVGLDLWLVAATRDEGFHYFQNAWQRLQGVVILWALLWFGWQVAALAALLWPSQWCDD